MHQGLRRLAAFAAAFVLAGAAHAEGAPAPLPIRGFMQRALIGDVAISPNGHRLAVLLPGPEGRARLGVLELNPLGQPRVIASYANADVTHVRWVNDNRLYYALYGGDRDHGVVNRAYAVDHDGGRLVDMPGGRLVRTLGDGSDRVLVTETRFTGPGEVRDVVLFSVDTLTGKRRSLSLGAPDGMRGWLSDDKGVPHVVSTYEDGRLRVYWRARETDKWAGIADFDPVHESGIAPALLDADGGLLVMTRGAGDVEALHRYDPVARRLDDIPLVRLKGFDLLATAETEPGSGRLLGLHFLTDAPHSYWFDPALGRVQAAVDAALPPDRRNRLYCGHCETTRFFVVRSTSDRQPGEYFLYDRAQSSLERIGSAYPWLDENGQGRRTFHRVATRDGLQMPVYVTHPSGAAPDAPLPAVVLVHGGPYVRGSSLRWDAEAQFLASRGYRVLQPEFRGTAGYGFRHFQAGWKQWGRAMQDDLLDAVNWAARERLVDPARVCIVGASYGGYAALMGPIVHPGAYRCAASFAGVTDIGLMYSIIYSDLSDDDRRYAMPVMIGDPDKDGDLLKTVSPLLRAAEIKVPVLVGHGTRDRRVPIKHARAFVSAAREAGVDVESVEYDNEGHGFFWVANAVDYHGRLERLLARTLGAPAAASAPASAAR